jgi:glyoxylase-like metal-dependent hydrolase (beta-lactamase superfamily II)
VLEDGEIIRVGDLEIEAVALPAYSQEAFVFRHEHVVFTGPALGAGSVGYEHPGYAEVLLREMIEQKLLSLPRHTVVLPREGPPSTIGLERDTNAAFTVPTDQ